MPQLDQSTWISQLFWLAVTFGLLWLFVRSYVAPRLQKIVGTRESAIGGDLESAEAARKRTRDVEAEHDAAVTAARTKARELVAGAQGEASAKTSARLDEARKAASSLLAEAKTRIDTAQSAALGEIETVAAEASREIVSRVAGLDIDQKAALAEVQKA